MEKYFEGVGIHDGKIVSSFPPPNTLANEVQQATQRCFKWMATLKNFRKLKLIRLRLIIINDLPERKAISWMHCNVNFQYLEED